MALEGSKGFQLEVRPWMGPKLIVISMFQWHLALPCPARCFEIQLAGRVQTLRGEVNIASAWSAYELTASMGDPPYTAITSVFVCIRILYLYLYLYLRVLTFERRGEYSQHLICIRAHSLNGWAALYSHYVQHLQQLYHHPPMPDAFILHTYQPRSFKFG